MPHGTLSYSIGTASSPRMRLDRDDRLREADVRELRASPPRRRPRRRRGPSCACGRRPTTSRARRPRSRCLEPDACPSAARRPTLTTTLSTSSDCCAVTGRCTAPSSDAPRSTPSTVTPVSTLMPRFLNARTTTSAACLSTPGRMSGSASSSVTSAPTSTRYDANSQPIAPPPMIAVAGGDLGRARGRGRTTGPVGAVERQARAARAARSRSRGSTRRRCSSVPSETRT